MLTWRSRTALLALMLLLQGCTLPPAHAANDSAQETPPPPAPPPVAPAPPPSSPPPALPPDTAHLIASLVLPRLDGRALASAAQVCREWRAIIRDDPACCSALRVARIAAAEQEYLRRLNDYDYGYSSDSDPYSDYIQYSLSD